MTAALSLASHEQTLHTSPHCFSGLVMGHSGGFAGGEDRGQCSMGALSTFPR